MRMSLSNGIIQLDALKPLAIRDARGVRLECTAGRVWLTVQGQPGDFYLAAGDGLCLASNGLALVEGMPRGSVRLVAHSPWPVRWAGRLLRRLYRRRPQRGHGTAGAAI
ncbi:DUF2917 domain-containing protein [Aromatoleum diolicum]|uniref:DUF2917 domain-containing protein n=1 Tax=Aromatoleum diolicum TaxID=75796 RepID=A0ABX1Q8K8_9RHOO|nr:DUF2917 domain-containing protein [Aromatoleum diolicum]NMG74400.1 DUF2917 domain-containing protein [Aromatoleum diolicum]